jgi:hypothetical protein
MRELAAAQIADKGQKAYYVRNVNPTPADPTKPWIVGPVTQTEVEFDMVFLPDNRNSRETKNYVNRSEVPKGNTRCLAYGLTFEPQLKDTIRRPLPGGDIIYSIESIIVVQPDASGAILYKFRLG